MKTEDIKITPQWTKGKEEIWSEVFSEINEKNTTLKIKQFSFLKYAAAAVFALIIAGTSFVYLYTRTETAASGVHIFVTLPDGSNVSLNAESKIKYKPFLWFLFREVTLKGEACFEVVQGKKFTVKSGQNQVKVLGTSFNVFARAEKYCVTCLSGKVEVFANGENVILTPNKQATLRKGIMKIDEIDDAEQSIGWMQNKFMFIGVPLSDVVKEIERQYDIRISTTSNLDHIYTGNFSKSNNPEDILLIIGKPFGITFNIKK